MNPSVSTSGTPGPKRNKRDQIELAVEAVRRLSVDDLAKFATKMKTDAPKFTAALATELRSHTELSST